MSMLMSVIDWFYIVHKTGVTGVATMQIKIAFLSSISSACLTLCRYFLFLTLSVIIVLLRICYCYGA